MKRFLLFFVAALLFVACDNKFEDVGNTIQGVSNLPTLTAEFAEEDTRTYVEDNIYLRWHEGDLISAFVGNTRNSKYLFEGNTGDNGGTFGSTDSSLGSSDKLDRNYALYPYDKSVNISVNGVVSCSLPAVQEYAEESFGKGANTMVAVTKSTDDTFLAFKNACGYLKIKLYGNATIKSIELKGNNGEKIAGKATISAEYGAVPQIVMSEDATESITLDCGEGVKLSTDAEKPTEFWFVVPPTEFSEGLTIVATDTNGTTFVKSTSNTVTITRNEIQPMAALEAIFRDPTPANNEIWYTSSNGKIVEPYSGQYNDYADALTTFGANIVSNNYKEGRGVIAFDGDVTTIGDEAFWDCDSLTTVTIPDNVTTIGDEAFWDCDSLTTVTIPDNVTTIGEWAFLYCDSLTSVTIGDSVTTIGDAAFAACTSLKEFKGKFASDNGRCLIVDGVLNSFAIGCGATDYTIPDSVTTIGDYAFLGCYSLTSVTIPDSVTTIGNYAFQSCTSLTSVTIPDSVTRIGEGTFYYCRSLTSVTIPDSVTTIGDGVFYSCTSLTSVRIPDSVATIGDLAFYNCTSLTSVTIPDSVTTIGGGAFYECDSLTSVIIPDRVTTIGDAAFYSCTSLTSVTIPDSVTTIGDEAFSYCRSLTSVTIPDSVTTIGDSAFYWCPSLTSVTIGDSVTTIGGSAFRSCDSLTSVTIGDSVTTIGDEAFAGCYSLTSVTIGDSVTTIGNSAFYYCTSLTSVTIGDSVTTIGDEAFAYCDSLKEFKGKFAADNGRCLIVDGVLNSFAIGCGATEYTIPDSVTTIGESAFEDCDSLTSVTIPDSVTTIGNDAFDSCSKLTSVTIPDSVTTIGFQAFAECTSLTSVYCKATTPPSLGSNAFKYYYYRWGYTNIGCTIYVPRGCGSAYKSAPNWNDYAADIVEYDF